MYDASFDAKDVPQAIPWCSASLSRAKQKTICSIDDLTPSLEVPINLRCQHINPCRSLGAFTDFTRPLPRSV
jgi:hypothetical protein